MTDGPRTPPLGVGPRAATAVSRPPPRDTSGELQKLVSEVNDLATQIDSRLSIGVERFATLEEKVRAAQSEAAKAMEATRPQRLEWSRVVPIVASLLGLLVTVVVTMDRKVGRDQLEQVADRAEARAAGLERDVASLRAEVAAAKATSDTLRGVLEAVSTAVRAGRAPAASTARGR